MSQNIDLAQEFDKWRKEHSYSDDADLRAAYTAGARRMSQDTLDTLRDYATATAGLDNAELFDTAAENLMIYYTQVLQDIEFPRISTNFPAMGERH